MPDNRVRTQRPTGRDVVLTAACLAFSLAQLVVAPVAALPVGILVAVGTTLPLLWRRAFPATAALTGTAFWLIPTPDGFLLLGYVVGGLLYYAVGLHVAAASKVVAVTAAGTLLAVTATLLSAVVDPVAIGSALVVIGPAVGGRLVARARAQSARLGLLTAELMRERAAAERTAVAEERARIARELHDVVGHEVSVIALQADAAAAALRQCPERAAAPIETIRAAAADALAEMRQLVGLLRSPGEGDGTRPQPGLADLPALVEGVRSAGVPVVFELHHPESAPPLGVQLTAYRVVQEALTNAGRHAPGSDVSACVDGRSGALCVEVISSGGGAGRGPGGGHGLVGMRERVRMHGGELVTGATGDGFAVRARLPLTPAPR